MTKYQDRIVRKWNNISSVLVGIMVFLFCIAFFYVMTQESLSTIFFMLAITLLFDSFILISIIIVMWLWEEREK